MDLRGDREPGRPWRVNLGDLMPTPGSLCLSCRFVREIVSGKGSRFLLCEKPLTDPRFAKYPPQPVVACAGYERKPQEEA